MGEEAKRRRFPAVERLAAEVRQEAETARLRAELNARHYALRLSMRRIAEVAVDRDEYDMMVRLHAEVAWVEERGVDR